MTADDTATGFFSLSCFIFQSESRTKGYWSFRIDGGEKRNDYF